jgi:hypothetical protein
VSTLPTILSQDCGLFGKVGLELDVAVVADDVDAAGVEEDAAAVVVVVGGAGDGDLLPAVVEAPVARVEDVVAAAAALLRLGAILVWVGGFCVEIWGFVG